jgi:hypothetical protein
MDKKTNGASNNANANANANAGARNNDTDVQRMPVPFFSKIAEASRSLLRFEHAQVASIRAKADALDFEAKVVPAPAGMSSYLEAPAVGSIAARYRFEEIGDVRFRGATGPFSAATGWLFSGAFRADRIPNCQNLRLSALYTPTHPFTEHLPIL